PCNRPERFAACARSEPSTRQQTAVKKPAARFTVREHLQNLNVSCGREPVGSSLNCPSAFARPTADEPGTFSPTGGEGQDEGVRFLQRVRRVATERRMQRE